MDFLENYKEKIKRQRLSDSWILRLQYRIIKDGFLLFSFLTDSIYRKQLLSRLLYRKHFHQISHYTEADRYPDLFEICQNYLKDKENSRILSFGCSTGEEVFTLSEYLPHATIVGTDISNWCIHECMKKDTEHKFTFIQSLSKEFSRLENFDAIFCLAVFQNPANRYNKDNEYSLDYSFEKFEKQLVNLDKKLNKGGILLIDQCDFNFLETDLSKKYEILKADNNPIIRDRPLYNRTNQKISDESNLFRVFVKLKP